MTFPKKDDLVLNSFLSNYSGLIHKGMESIDEKNFLFIVNILEKAILNKKNIFTCGNGGSSSIAEHFVCDFVKGVSTDTSISPKVNSLTSNMPLLSAIANDIEYDDVFSYQLEKYGSKGDLLFCISSSGNSKNIINAIDIASKMKIKTISLVGFSGGIVKKISDNCIHINISNYGIVEDIHQSIMHMMAQYIRLRKINKLDKVEKIIF
jgi:D-sedoheptulose 7-phosphate isomerase